MNSIDIDRFYLQDMIIMYLIQFKCMYIILVHHYINTRFIKANLVDGQNGNAVLDIYKLRGSWILLKSFLSACHSRDANHTPFSREKRPFSGGARLVFFRGITRVCPKMNDKTRVVSRKSSSLRCSRSHYDPRKDVRM